MNDSTALAPQPVHTVTLTAIQAVNDNPLVAYADPGIFEQLQRAGKMLAASDFMPQQYRNNVANCVGALIVASRMNMTPYEVAQHLYIIHGKTSWSATFLIARLRATNRWRKLHWEWKGTEGSDDWGARYVGIDRMSGENDEGPWVTIKMAKAEGWYGKSGSKWQTLPELMLQYRSATFFSRLYAPETTLGFLTVEEAQDIGPQEPITNGQTATDLSAELKAAADGTLVDGEMEPTRDPLPLIGHPYQDERGRWYVHLNAEEIEYWSDSLHSSGRDPEGRPHVNQDGSFRRRRGVVLAEQVGKVEAPESTPGPSEAPDMPPDPPPEDEPQSTQITVDGLIVHLQAAATLDRVDELQDMARSINKSSAEGNQLADAVASARLRLEG